MYTRTKVAPHARTIGQRSDAFSGLIAGAIGGTLIGFLKLIIPIHVAGQPEPLLLLVGRVFGSAGLMSSILILLAVCTLGGIFYALAFRPFLIGLPNSERIFNPTVSGIIYGGLIWFVGGLLIAPAATGIPAIKFALPDLFCWLVYGVTVALIYHARRTIRV